MASLKSDDNWEKRRGARNAIGVPFAQWIQTVHEDDREKVAAVYRRLRVQGCGEGIYTCRIMIGECVVPITVWVNLVREETGALVYIGRFAPGNAIHESPRLDCNACPSMCGARRRDKRSDWMKQHRPQPRKRHECPDPKAHRPPSEIETEASNPTMRSGSHELS